MKEEHKGSEKEKKLNPKMEQHDLRRLWPWLIGFMILISIIYFMIVD